MQSDSIFRALDLSIVFFCFPFFCILLPTFTILNLVFSPDGVFYSQRRVGMNGHVFSLYKFKTMRDGDRPDQHRVTNFGAFLRKTSMDELPQVVNVILGDMSIVGPRPVPYLILSKISHSDRVLRSEIPPGITGYSQVFYRGEKRDFKEKVKLDIFYVKNKSVKLYFYIILKTFLVLFYRYKYSKGQSL